MDVGLPDVDALLHHPRNGASLEGFSLEPVLGITASMQIAMHDLQLDRLCIVYPGERRYALTERIDAVPLAALI